MRISDWSSDVCSSDLRWSSSAANRIISKPIVRPAPVGPKLRPQAVHANRRGVSPSNASSQAPAIAAGKAGRDRESVGEGKSVAGRVDVGGRRIIKKKKEQK